MYDYLRALRAAPDYQITLIGGDANSETQGRFFVDHFEAVPFPEPKEQEYIDRLLAICQKHKVQGVIPGSEGESRVISKYRQLFSQHQIQTSVGDYETVLLMTDKLRMLEFLRGKDIETGPFFEVNSGEDAAQMADKLGYPRHKVVLKPRSGAGSRGILIADAHGSSYTPLLKNRLCGTGSLEVLLEQVKIENTSLNNYYVMPYYGDIAYDIDCLSAHGKVTNVVPRRREYKNPLSPVNEGCQIELHPGIIQYIGQLCKAFNVHGACDYDIALSVDGAPRLLDASCRLSGSVGASFSAGVNFPAQLVRLLFNLPLHEYPVKDGTRLRPVNHIVQVI